MADESESVFELEIKEDPTGPWTLHQEIRITDSALRAMETARHGSGFIPLGTMEKTRRGQTNLHARMSLLLGAHPELEHMYAEHEQLLSQYYANKKAGTDVAETQRKCADLARKIVALEQSEDSD